MSTLKALKAGDLVLQNLRRKPLRTGILVAVVALFALTLFCSTLIGKSVGDGTRIMAGRLGADVLFVPHGYERKLEGSLLRGEPSTFYLDGGFEKAIQGTDGVARTSSQLFVASLRAACCTLPVQIIGFDSKTDFVVTPWIEKAGKSFSGGSRPLADTEIVVGSKIAGEPGERISLFGKEFTIAAKLDRTGMGFDTSVFMDINRARRLLVLNDIVDLPEDLDKKTFVSSTLVKLSDPAAAKEVTNAILRRHAIEYNLDFVLVAGMVSDISGKLHGFSLLLYALSGFVWLLAATVLLLVFSVIVHERRKEFGLLRLMGATRRDLSALILREALLISCAGALLGLLAACAVILPFEALIAAKLGVPSLQPDLASLLAIAAGAFCIAALTGPLAAVQAVLKLGRSDAYLAVREEA